MGKLLESCTLPKLNKEEIEHLSRSVTSKGMELLIKTLTTKKSPEPEGFTYEFYRVLKAEVTPILYELSPEK